MENKKLYAIDRDFEIIEFEIIKETPNQYVAKPINKKYFTFDRTIKKSTMESHDLIFRCALADIKLLRQEEIKQTINRNNERIANLSQRNIELTRLLTQSQEDAANER